MKSYTAIIAGAVWLLSIAAAFYAGMSSSTVKPGENEATSSSTASARRSVAFSSGSRDSQGATSRAGGAGAQFSGGADGVGGSEFAQSLRAAATSGDLVERSLALASLLQNLSAENLEEAKAVFAEFEGDWSHRAELELFMHAWSRFDAAGALSYAKDEMPGRYGHFAAYSVLSGWAERDTGAALEWSLQQEGNDRNRSIAMIVGMQAESDPTAALATLSTLPEDAFSGQLYDRVARNLTKTDPQRASQWAASITDDKGRSTAMREVAREWAETDPQAAAVWVQQYADDDASARAVTEIAGELASTDIDYAKNWVSGLRNENTKSAAMSNLVSQWAKDDPNSAGIWLNQQAPGAGLDKAVGVFSRRVAESDPSSAITWAETITDNGSRNSLLVELGRYWASEDSAAAAAWVEQSGLSDGAKNSVLKTEQGSRVRSPWSRLDGGGDRRGGGRGR